MEPRLIILLGFIGVVAIAISMAKIAEHQNRKKMNEAEKLRNLKK